MVKRFPLRQRKNAMTDAASAFASEGRGFFEMGRLLAGFAESAALARQGSSASQSSHGGTGNSIVPRMDMPLTGTASALSQPMLALCDAPAASEPDTVAPARTSLAEAGAPQSAAAQELDRLRAELFAEEADAEPSSLMKRPAARESVRSRRDTNLPQTRDVDLRDPRWDLRDPKRLFNGRRDLSDPTWQRRRER